MKPILNVENLSINAGPKTLVSNVSFKINKGERLGLIGESGSGKSLTSLAAIGLLPESLHASGSILLAEKQVIGSHDKDLAPLRGTASALIFQEPLTALDPLMKLGRQVREVVLRRAKRDGRSLDRQTADAEVLGLLRQVALPDPDRIAQSWPHQISGGQRQRVAIAMALACRPQLLIADEPTTALDVTTQAQILDLLLSLVRQRDMSLLFISHDLPVVASVVERVVVMRNGHVAEQGAINDVFRHPTDSYTQSLVAAARAFDDALGMN